MGEVLTFKQALVKKKEIAEKIKKCRGKSYYIVHEEILVPGVAEHEPLVHVKRLQKLMRVGKGVVFLQPPLFYGKESYLRAYLREMRKIVGPSLTIILLPPTKDALFRTWDPKIAKTPTKSWQKLTDFMKEIGNKEVCLGGRMAMVAAPGTEEYKLRSAVLRKMDKIEIEQKPWLWEKPRLYTACVKRIEENLATRGIVVKYAAGFFYPDTLISRRKYAPLGSLEQKLWEEHTQELKVKERKRWVRGSVRKRIK